MISRIQIIDNRKERSIRDSVRTFETVGHFHLQSFGERRSQRIETDAQRSATLRFLSFLFLLLLLLLLLSLVSLAFSILECIERQTVLFSLEANN